MRLNSSTIARRLIISAERGRTAIKSAVQAAGIESQPTLLLLEEHHVREESLAVLVSAIVSKGEIPGLFTADELDALVAPLADFARREDFQGTLEHYLYHRAYICSVFSLGTQLRHDFTIDNVPQVYASISGWR